MFRYTLTKQLQSFTFRELKFYFWESRPPHVLQRFVGTNFLSDGDLSDNLRTKHPENTWSDTSLYAELVRLFHAATLPVTFFASASTAAKWQLAWQTIRQMIKERWQFWAKKRFLKVGSYLRKISISLGTCAASSTKCPNFRGLLT